ncbi:hypothetical protein HHK36_026173 [Tetracentron sinense]|uniref:F-box domain-containing protein n=1 Tax=Tetracentron sinense TaxID=13715 RepID=A0A835D3Q7_TETSI|nr:hypothetical protein HHK36_026173 [Tetracentron sinense]
MLNSDDDLSESSMIGNKDVMIDVLSRLPLKSLLKSKCVCKCWNSLISDPIFIHTYSRRNPHHFVFGLFLQKFFFLEMYSDLEFITLGGDANSAPKTSLSFIQDKRGVHIRHSCNGLLVCSSFRCSMIDRIYYICKPTTKQYLVLPTRPGTRAVLGINVAFDPNRSPHYKVICICDSELSQEHRQIYIYSSDTRFWKPSGDYLFATSSGELLYDQGVFWNGALHWVGLGDSSLRFDVERERLFIMPMPPIPEGREERRLRYFGESGGHLHLIEIYGPHTSRFYVMEMKPHYSGWFVKYRVNLDQVAIQYPVMVRRGVPMLHRFVFSVLHLVRGGVGEESFLVLHIPGKFIKFNLEERTFVEISNLSPGLMTMNKQLGLEYKWDNIYPYTNILSNRQVYRCSRRRTSLRLRCAFYMGLLDNRAFDSALVHLGGDYPVVHQCHYGCHAFFLVLYRSKHVDLFLRAEPGKNRLLSSCGVPNR